MQHKVGIVCKMVSSIVERVANAVCKIFSYCQCFQQHPTLMLVYTKKILDWSRSQAISDDNFVVTQMIKYVLDWIENIVGKGKNAGYQLFFLSPHFQRPL